MSHTQTPWKAVDSLHRWNITTVDGPRTFNICALNTDRVEQEANAQHIVHCVNTYPALVAALEGAYEYVSASADLHHTNDKAHEAVDAIREALALARKEGL